MEEKDSNPTPDSNPSPSSYLPQSEGIEGLQLQFEEQQTLISQLKGALQTNEQQRASKGKEIEQYAAKLSNIKLRTRTSKRSKSGDVNRTSEDRSANEKIEQLQSTSKQEQLESTSKQEQLQSTSKQEQPQSVLKQEPTGKQVVIESEGEKKELKKGSKNSSEKTKLLRKKLEENRMKFEQRGKEISESKKGIEEMVENLRMQLEERDQVIQTLQKGLESSSGFTPFPVHVPNIETSCALPDMNVNEDSDSREMYAQIVYKDNKIVELNNRIVELEVKVLDLQENLKEKDAVIDARTKAITLMSEDMSRKSKTTIDSLDDTREQMRLMQNNFITLEGRMKEENVQLKKQLDEKDRKLSYAEESYKNLESVRFELTTTIAELQEKVVHLQTMNSVLQKQVADKIKEKEAKGEKQGQVEELLKALEESNKQLLKAKAQHKTKVKSLTKQVESLKKVSESSDEILRLQQRVAELEEDKGNLQLHLVDFDEFKATEHSWKERLRELEEKVKQQNEDLDSHVSALSQLEREKLNLIEGFQTEKLKVYELETELATLKCKYTELEDLKVSTEMKAVELEELIDMLSNEKDVLLKENKCLSDDKNEYKQLLDTLQQEKLELLEEISSLQTILKENNPNDTDSNRSEFQMVSSNNSDEEKWKRLPTPEEHLPEEKHVKDSSNAELYIKLLESELEDARRIIAEEKDTIHDLKLKLESKEEEIEMHLEVISKLEQLGREVSSHTDHEGDVNKISEILKELNEMTGDLEEWKNRCTEVEDRLKCLEDEKVNLQNKLMDVTNENSVLNAQLSLQKQVSEDLATQVKEKDKIISEKDELITNHEKLKFNEQEKKELFEFSESDTLGVTSDQSEISGKYIALLQQELEELKKACLEYEKIISERNLDISLLRGELKENQEEIVCLKQKLQAKDETGIIQLQKELKEKEALLEHLKTECYTLKNDLDKIVTVVSERSSQESTSENNKLQELQNLLDEKVAHLSEKEEELEKTKGKLKTVAEKAKRLAVNLKAKTVVLQNLEEKEAKYFENIQEKENIISQINTDIEKLNRELELWKSNCEDKEKLITNLNEKLGSIGHDNKVKIENLIMKNEELIATNHLLSNELEGVQKRIREDSLHMENHSLELTNQISGLQREVLHLSDNLQSKIEEIKVLKSECAKVEEEKALLLDNKAQIEIQNEALTANLEEKENKLADLSSKLEYLTKSIETKDEHLERNSYKCKELEQMIVTKDMQVTALEDRMSAFQNSWSALEAKLQEREAVIESLEQELAKSHSRQQYLEEGLSGIEERRRSLENKFAILGEQLQESDRVKVQAEEHEWELEDRLAALASSEETLRKRLENLNEQNVELSQKITELLLDNENLKRSITNTENNLKNSIKEIERLSGIESAHLQALENIEKLQHDFKIRSVEFDRSLKEKENLSHQQVETLELDMRNLSQQLEALETEKRCFMERCETLNDIKLNLEDDIEVMQEKIMELEKMNSQKELDFQMLLADKQCKVKDLEEKIQQLETSARQVIVPFDRETVRTQTEESDDHVDSQFYKSEIESLTKLLNQRELEIQSYQNRLLQLQFSPMESKICTSGESEQTRKELENTILEIQEKLKIKESQLEELKGLLQSTNSEMNDMRIQLKNSCNKIDDMSGEINRLHDLLKSKELSYEDKVENLSLITNDELKQKLESINSDYQKQLAAMQMDFNNIYQELVQEKAKNIVSDIVSSAQLFAESHKKHETTVPSRLGSHADTVLFSDSISNKVLESEEPQDNKEQFSVRITEETDLSFAPDLNSDIVAKQKLLEEMENLRAEIEFLKFENVNAVAKIAELDVNSSKTVDERFNKQDKLLNLTLHQDSIESVGDAFSKESSAEGDFSSEGNKYRYFTFNTEDKAQINITQDSQLESFCVNSNVQEIVSPERDKTAEATLAVELMEEEEGWGWGVEEARLEEEHMERQKAALVMPEQQFQVLELENKIDLLEKEKMKLTEELKASQLRSGKMLKKLKELKIKNESLMRENQELALKKSNEFGGLDLAIEEELKIRIDSLEKELKECKGEKDAVNVEKEALQKRVEILSTANERLTEREHQIDVEFWQNKCKELNNQIQSLQWKIEELLEDREMEKPESKTSNIQEYQEQITALASDNEQLQNMLEEQRNLRVAAEAALKDLQQYTSSKEANFLEQSDLRENYVALQGNYELLQKELEAMHCNTGLDSLVAENAILRENYEVLNRELQQLRSTSNSDVIAAEYTSMRNNYETIYNELEKLRSQVDLHNNLQANYESLQISHEKLVNEMNCMEKEYYSLNEKYEIIIKEKCSLQDELNEKIKELQESCDLIKVIEKEKSDCLSKFENVSSELSSMLVQMQHLINENETHKISIANVSKELEHVKNENVALRKENENLKSTNQDLTIENSNANIPTTSDMFQLFQASSNIGKELFPEFGEVDTTIEPKVDVDISKGSFPSDEMFSKDKEESLLLQHVPHDSKELDENNVEKKVKELEMKIAELEEIKQQKIDELRILRDMFSSEQEEWVNTEQRLSNQIEILQKELGVAKEFSAQESEIRECLAVKEIELSSIKSQLSNTKELLAKTQNQVCDLEAQLKQKEEEFQSMNRNSFNQENRIQDVITSKEQEINNLKETLFLRLKEQEDLIISKEKDLENLKIQMLDRETETENVLKYKDEDIQNLKIQITEMVETEKAVNEERDKNIQNLQSQLLQSNEQVELLTQTLNTKEQQILEMQELLEAREDEIREAVLQIRDKNREIRELRQISGFTSNDRLVQSQPSDSAVTSNLALKEASQTDANQQSELDLALYMLHQRDVRCEELTHELMQLLEERDTLQLRLSTALRINEDLRNRLNNTLKTASPLKVPLQEKAQDTSSTSEDGDVYDNMLSPIDPQPITDAVPGEPREDLNVLANKLSQLHSVGYHRDVTLQDEREQRHSEQVMLLQSRTPGVLVESNYTLSRDVQSPSTVLLNWIWGRSTPKVMHI